MKHCDIFISFFNSYPITSGASAVTTSFYKSWPKEKKLFMLNHEKLINEKNIYNYKLFSNHFLIKTFFFFFYVIFIYLKIRKENVKNIIFEGASWTGYIYISFLILKFLIPKSKYIYHAHNVDFFFRKKNFLLSKISFFFEKHILKNFDISTAVSKNDQKQLKKLFKVSNIQILPNGLEISNKLLNKKKNTKPYIIFSGSLEYEINRKIFNKLYNNEFQILKKYFKGLKIYLTGGGKNKFLKEKDIKELGTLKNNKYLQIMRESLLIVVPGSSNTGTKIKIIEALIYNKIILVHKDSMSGLNTKLTKYITYKNLFEFEKKLKIIIKNKFKIKIYKKISENFIKNYDSKKIISRFINENNL